MTRTASEIPRILIERIESAYPRPVLFSATETDEWPAEVLGALVECGALQLASRAESAWCPGCEWQCHKAVVVRTGLARPHTEAFITCNEAPDLGRIGVPVRKLGQYSATLRALSKLIADQMTLGNPKPSAASASFLLGSIRGRYGPCQITVCFDARELWLRVGGEREPLIHVLMWDGVGLAVDGSLIRRLAKRKGAGSPSRVSRPPDRSIRLDRVRSTGARHKAIFAEAKKKRGAGESSWTAIAAAIAQTNLALTENGRRLTVASVRRIVSEMHRRERESFRSNRAGQIHQ